MVGVNFKDDKNLSIGLTDAQLGATIDVDPELIRIGYEVIERQKKETFREAWTNHWRAALWSMFLTGALVMEGYDTAIINSFYALPAFLNTFGIRIIGLFINGWVQERYGARKAFIGGMIFMTLTIFLAVFAFSLNFLLFAEFAMGIPWGMFQTLSTAYAAEICPIRLRGYLNAFASVGYGSGSFIASGVLKGTVKMTGSMGWRLAYILQWVWPVPLALGCFFAPESPWWLTRHGKFEEAEKTIVRNARPGFYAEREAEGFVAFMRHTDALEKVEAEQGSWVEMFKGVNLRRTEIMLGVWGVQLWNGNIVTGLTAELLENAGMSATGAFNINLVLSAMAIIGVMISWVLLGRMGRRPIYLGGIISIGCCLLPTGVLGFVKQTKPGLNASAAFLILINLFFHFSLGPVCYSIVGELPAARLRSRSIVLGRFFYLVSAIIGTQLRARMIAVDSWNWGTKSCLFWLGCNLICLTWAFFRLPETGGFSFTDLDILFANKVPTRKFKKYKIRDETAQIGVHINEKELALTEKADIEHVESVNHEVVGTNEREELETVEPVQGRLVTNI